ncbi:MAG: 50S ribosomal protein L9 [Actinobacteria bacterium]|nr:50S ribosomal protein L9 [Actinomycetota bacterium]
MKVILKNEVDNLGLPGDVVDVADGYGRNFLIPRGLAILATKGAMKEAEAITRSRKAAEAKTVDSAYAMKETLESRTLRVPARVDESGNLYGSVGVNDVHRVLKDRGHDIEKRRIDLKGTIKRIGEYEVPIRVHPQVEALVTVEVVDEEGKVTLGGPAVDEDAITDAATDAAEGSETDADVLAEQALEAAKEYETQRVEAGADVESIVPPEAGTDEAVASEAPSEADTADETVAEDEPAGTA